MGGRLFAVIILGLLAFAPAAHAQNFSLSHSHGGQLDATAAGTVAFPDAGGATVSVTVTDRSEDGWCAAAWVTSNLPPSTHKIYQACGVGEQKTFSLSLPATARCNVTFVEVQAGRIDHSANDKTELGQYKRMLNPCPPLPTPTPTPTPTPPPPPPPAPAPAPPPAKVTSAVSHFWYVTHRYTRNRRLLVRNVPAGGAVELRCHGHGCPSRRPRNVPVHSGHANVHRVLGNHHLRPGTWMDIRITAPGMVGKVLRLKVRRTDIPSQRRLCLPIGATSATRC
jgi:hypothetical protein